MSLVGTQHDCARKVLLATVNWPSVDQHRKWQAGCISAVMNDSTTLLPPDSAFQLPAAFNYAEYIDCEQELWALFPECTGKRVNFIQAGLSAFLYAEMVNDGTDLAIDQTYMLMPHPDRYLRPIRMKCVRRLSIDEYRLSTYTALKASGHVLATAFREAANIILGEELLSHAQASTRQ